MWVDSKDGRVPMETVIMTELVPHVDATFRTQSRREARAVEGFSMGGYGAARLGFKFTTHFAAVSLLAGGPLQATLTAADGPPSKAEDRVRVLNAVYGNDQDYFKANSPRVLAEANAQALRTGTVIRQIVGALDATLPANRDFHDQLIRLGLPHSYIEVAGVDHDALALIDTLGDGFWSFHRAAFAPLSAAGRATAAGPAKADFVIGLARARE